MEAQRRQSRPYFVGEGALTGFSSRNWPNGHPSGGALSEAIAWSRKATARQHGDLSPYGENRQQVGRPIGGAKADYIQREGKYARDMDEVLHAESGHMPEFVERPADYWDAADLYERANGRLFKEVEFALPVELTLDQQKALASEFAQHLTGAERLPYTLAIHAGGGENPATT